MKNRKNFKKKNFRKEDSDEFSRKERRRRPKLPKKINKHEVYSLLEEEEDDLLDENSFSE